MELVSFEELDLFDDESEDDGYVSVSASTCNYPFCSNEPVGSVVKPVGRVSGIGSGVFVLTGIE